MLLFSLRLEVFKEGTRKTPYQRNSAQQQQTRRIFDWLNIFMTAREISLTECNPFSLLLVSLVIQQ